MTATKRIIYKKIPASHRLIVEISQNGIVQKRRIFRLNRLLKKNIRIGFRRRLEFSFQTNRLPKVENLFFIGRNEAGVCLSGNMSGFVSTDNGHASIDDYFNSETDSENKNVVIPLTRGSRGSVRVSNFDISFKFSELTKTNVRKKVKIQGAGLDIFSLPHSIVRLEKFALMLAVGACCIAFGSVFLLFKNVHYFVPTSVINLSSKVQFSLIHPRHFGILPIVYRNEFDSLKPQVQAIRFVDAFLQRASDLEHGKPHISKFDELNSGVGISALAASRLNWETSRNREIEVSRSGKTNALNARYFKFIDKNVEFTSQMSGRSLGSVRLQQRRRIEQIDRAYNILQERYVHEFETLNDEYAKYELKFGDPALKPEFGRIKEVLLGKGLGIRFEDDFVKERENTLAARRHVSIAAATNLRTALSERLVQEKSEGRISKVAWMSEDSLVRDEDTLNLMRNKIAVDSLWKNAAMAFDPSLIPKPEPPKATINMSEVHRVIFTKREQVKACYDSALRRNVGLAGKLQLGWVVAVDGRAKGVTIKGHSLNDSVLIGCIKTRLQTWQFPKPKNGEISIVYPFEFNIGE